MAAPEPLDLLHLGNERVIGAYLLETEDGLALFDCGAASTVEALKRRLAERGLVLTDVRHLLLSHIHLDHAGAAGVLAREHPALTVHVSPVGAPHLVDPARLERSARRLYGEAFDTLWGELAPVTEQNVRVTESRVLGLECFPTPGHASHHVCYLDEDGTLYAGDAAGVRIQPSTFVVPPAPPPEFDLEAWLRSLDEIERREPAWLALIHFGVAEDVAEHLVQLRERLHTWTADVERGASEAEFVATRQTERARRTASDETAYDQAIPFVQSYAGIARYCAKRAERAA